VEGSTRDHSGTKGGGRCKKETARLEAAGPRIMKQGVNREGSRNQKGTHTLKLRWEKEGRV